MLDCEPVKSAMKQNHGLEECADQIPAYTGRYQRLLGRLIYLLHTRPDIAYAISVVSRFMHNLGKQHMDAVIRILTYLKSTPGKIFCFRNMVIQIFLGTETLIGLVKEIEDQLFVILDLLEVFL